MAVRAHTHTGHDAILVVDTHINAALLAFGRLIFGGYFIYSGLHHLLDHVVLASYAAQRGVPAPDLAVLGTGLLILIGGVCVATGAAPRTGAAMIALFLIGVTPIMHAFWNDPAPEQRAADIANFGKNIALLGTTCLLAAVPEAWPSARQVIDEAPRPM